MRVLIAGGGIGGLSAAIAMRRLGHEVVIVERAPELTEVGAAIACGTHAMRALEFLGAADHIRALNDPPEASQLIDMMSGEVLVSATLGEAGEERYGVKTYMTHRRDLIDALASQIEGAEMRLDSLVVAVEQDERSVRLILADGEAIEGDILIGADGLRSTVRAALFGESEAIFTGFLAWRTVVPATRYARTFPNVVRLWVGSGRHVVAYPIRKGEQFYSGFYVPVDEVRREDWQTSGDVNDLKASFVDVCPDVLEILEGVDSSFITGAFYRPPLDCWYRGRVVLLGDAAHPVLSTSGSGAAMTLEDAVALSGCMERHGSDFHAAFFEFQARRQPRTTAVLISSRADLQTFHETDPERRALRARVNAGMARLDPANYDRTAWLHAYNEVEQSQRPFVDILAETANPLVRAEARQAFSLWRAMFEPDDYVHGLISQRDGYERLMAKAGDLPSDVMVEAVDCDGVPALRLTPPGGGEGPAILHLHGGGYALGSAKGSAALAARIARAAGGWALVPDFRRVPEHGLEDMLADVAKAHDWAAMHAADILVSGESSGAGLAINLSASLRAQGRRLPLALWLLSPFVDATLTSPSIATNRRSEPWLDRRMLLALAGAATQGDDPALPLHSPVNHELAGLPPLRIYAATGEAIAGDARMLAARAAAAGVDVKLTMVDDSVHCFAQFGFLPEADTFLDDIRRHCEMLREAVSPVPAAGV